VQVPPLKEMLRDPAKCEWILAYARQNYQDESLLFWLDAEAYGHCAEEERLSKAKALWSEFLAAAAEHEVTVDALEKQIVLKAIEAAQRGPDLSASLFDVLKLELENVMSSNVYAEYCKMVRRKGKLDFACQDKAEVRVLTPSEVAEERRKGADLIEMLVIEPDNFSVLYALCQVYTLLESHEEEERAFLSGVVEILLEHHSLLTFLQHVLRREVGECTDINTLFRGRTVFTLLLADLLRRRPCARFLADCTKATIAEAQKLRGALEVDPGRIEGPPEEAKKEALRSAERLVKLSDMLLDRIRKRYSKCPPSLRKVFELLSHITHAKYPSMQWKIVGAVFFLRFVNPALSQPEKHALVSKEIPMHQRKSLVTVSKMLQFVTNDSRFDETSNPAHAVLNKWVAEQVSGIGLLFSQLVEVSEKDWNDEADIRAPKSREHSNASSPRASFSAKAMSDKLKAAKSRLDRTERLGEDLSPEQSLALRLRVLDTLIKYQVQVKELLSSNMKTMTQWAWLKEALSALLSNATPAAGPASGGASATVAALNK
jgi:hypothetical protein